MNIRATPLGVTSFDFRKVRSVRNLSTSAGVKGAKLKVSNSEASFLFKIFPSLELTASLPLKMDGWNTIVSFWGGLFSGAMLVSGRVVVKTWMFLFKEIFMYMRVEQTVHERGFLKCFSEMANFFFALLCCKYMYLVVYKSCPKGPCLECRLRWPFVCKKDHWRKLKL